MKGPTTPERRQVAQWKMADGSIVGSVEGMKALGDLCFINSVLVEHVTINQEVILLICVNNIMSTVCRLD